MVLMSSLGAITYRKHIDFSTLEISGLFKAMTFKNSERELIADINHLYSLGSFPWFLVLSEVFECWNLTLGRTLGQKLSSKPMISRYKAGGGLQQ
jgi:hypothetical protein